MTATASDRSAPDVPPTAATGVAASVQAWLHELLALAHDHVHLVSLEAQRAGRNLVRMLIAGIVAALLLVTAWLSAIGAILFWLVSHDGAWATGFFIVCVANVAAAAGLIAWIRQLARAALFSATLRQLRPRGEPA